MKDIHIEDLERLVNLCKIREEIIYRGYSNLLPTVNKEIEEYEKSYKFSIVNNTLIPNRFE